MSWIVEGHRDKNKYYSGHTKTLAEKKRREENKCDLCSKKGKHRLISGDCFCDYHYIEWKKINKHTY